MTTKLLAHNGVTNAAAYRYSHATNLAKLNGSAIGWSIASLDQTQGAGFIGVSVAGVTGPTNGVEVTINSFPASFISAPLDQDVTISGNITFNVWCGESVMTVNAGPQVVIERIDSTGAVVSTIINSEEGVEAGTSDSVHNWTAAPTSTNMLRGDRIRVRFAGNDVGTMAATGNFTVEVDGSAGANGDTYIQFTETFGFLTSDPTTTTIYLTDSASAIDPGGASVDTKEAWTSRGAGVQTCVTNTAAGWTAPIQATKTAGGNTVEWYTRPLQAFTLSAPVKVNQRGLESASTANVSVRCEIAITANDGTGATVWGATTTHIEATTTESADIWYVTGDDTAISDGQRLRIRFYIDDTPTLAMSTAQTHTLHYAGTSGGASGDTFLVFGQSLVEAAAGKASPIARKDMRMARASRDLDPWSVSGYLVPGVPPVA